MKINSVLKKSRIWDVLISLRIRYYMNLLKLIHCLFWGILDIFNKQSNIQPKFTNAKYFVFNYVLSMVQVAHIENMTSINKSRKCYKQHCTIIFLGILYLRGYYLLWSMPPPHEFCLQKQLKSMLCHQKNWLHLHWPRKQWVPYFKKQSKFSIKIAFKKRLHKYNKLN